MKLNGKVSFLNQNTSLSAWLSEDTCEFIPLFPELRIREERRADRVPGADVHLDADGGLQLAHGEAESGGALGREVRPPRASGMPSCIVIIVSLA